jgi:hypothetical protein
MLVVPFPTGHRPAEIDQRAVGGGMRNSFPCFGRPWAERPNGPDPLTGSVLEVSVDETQRNSAIQSFLFGFIQIQFQTLFKLLTL